MKKEELNNEEFNKVVLLEGVMFGGWIDNNLDKLREAIGKDIPKKKKDAYKDLIKWMEWSREVISEYMRRTTKLSNENEQLRHDIMSEDVGGELVTSEEVYAETINGVRGEIDRITNEFRNKQI